MECLVVMPIYFALLGGLFLVGEIVVNKMRVEIGDSVVTGLVADRIEVGIAPGDAMSYLFQDKIAGHGEFAVDAVNRSGSNEINYFSTKYMGYVSYGLYLPEWVRGWLSLGNVVAEDAMRDKDENGNELDWERQGRWKPDASERTPLTFYETFADPFRAYVVHRMKPADIIDQGMARAMKTAYNRARTARDNVQDWDGVTAGEMIHRGILEKVAGDGWLSYNPGNLSIGVPNSGSVPNRVKRNLWMYGQ